MDVKSSYGVLVKALLSFSDEEIIALAQNLDRLKEFSRSFLRDIFPATMTLGNRAYEILGTLEGGEKYISDKTMVNRAKKKNASLGREDCQYILDHQKEIPTALCGKVYFVFPDYLHPDLSGRIAYIYWDDDGWIQHWRWLGYGRLGHGRVLCRKPAAAGK